MKDTWEKENRIFKRTSIFSSKIIWEKDTGDFSMGKFSSGEFTAVEFDESGFSTGEFYKGGFSRGDLPQGSSPDTQDNMCTIFFLYWRLSLTNFRTLELSFDLLIRNIFFFFSPFSKISVFYIFTLLDYHKFSWKLRLPWIGLS